MEAELVTQITTLAQPVVEDLGYELFEVQFRREGAGWVLRLFIDKEGGVTVDDCALVSREVGQLLEVEDCIEHTYHLEVSSPGLNRPLRSLDDFRRFAGRLAKVTLKEPVAGQQVWVGTIAGVEDDEVSLAGKAGEVRFPYEKVAKARLDFEF